ncbi:MAG: dTDP-4-dehydrorhamnose reductase [Victivallaceae bacterium]|nr:dTDP-4-dehydrorhamnose reductase [Victivallaceae bacterium]
MKIMITGAKGMLGRTLTEMFTDDDIIPVDLPETDITDPRGFDRIVEASRPDVLIHCAAMTAVDRCESEVDLAYKINAFGSAVTASACRRHGVRMIAISTDYVFDGDADRPYHEFDRPTGGGSVYGQSKFAGEEAIRNHCPDHVICRISWLYGPGGPSFVHTMVALADGSRPLLKVVNDQIGNPTSTIAVARALRKIINRPELNGTFHLTCEGEASWYELAKEVFAVLKIRQEVVPCRTAEFPRPAPRPANSRLDKMMLRLSGLPPMPHWKTALTEFLNSEYQT